MEPYESKAEIQSFTDGGITVAMSFSPGGRSLQECLVDLLKIHLAQGDL